MITEKTKTRSARASRGLSLYERYLLPRMVHCACATPSCSAQRAKIVPLATGRVLEIGAGSGLNLRFYDPRCVEHVWALDPSAQIWALARRAVANAAFPVTFLQSPAEEIPLPDASVDTLLVTYTLCTIRDLPRALQEFRRTLAPGGRLLFCEHGRDPDERIRRWQNRLSWLWSRLFGGCRLNRHIPELLEAHGFAIRQVAGETMTHFPLVRYNYRGEAIPTPPAP